MKKTLLLATALVATISAATQAQTFTNASFETWHSYSVNTGIFPPNPIALTAPDGWGGVDSLIAGVTPLAGLAGIVITSEKQLFQSSLAHSGTSSAQLKSINAGDSVGNVPGVLVNAKVDIDVAAAASGSLSNLLSLLTYTGGTATTAQVDTVTAWISLDSTISVDNGIIIATAVKTVQGSNGDSTVTVGGGTMIVTRGSAAFREFKVPLIYADATVPQKLIVAFMSSNYLDTVHAGNDMKVDDVSYTYKAGGGTSITQPLLADSKILVYPNPAKNQIYFNLNASVKPSDFNLSIYDISGRMISNESLKQAINSKNVSDWSKGTYFYQLNDTKNNKADKGQFIVE